MRRRDLAIVATCSLSTHSVLWLLRLFNYTSTMTGMSCWRLSIRADSPNPSSNNDSKQESIPTTERPNPWESETGRWTSASTKLDLLLMIRRQPWYKSSKRNFFLLMLNLWILKKSKIKIIDLPCPFCIMREDNLENKTATLENCTRWKTRRKKNTQVYFNTWYTVNRAQRRHFFKLYPSIFLICQSYQ